jgi:hypothetical protein
VQPRHWLEPFVIRLGGAVLVQMGAERLNPRRLGFYLRMFPIRNVRYLRPVVKRVLAASSANFIFRSLSNQTGA